ncbi:hypothetical protein, partial [Methylobacter sp. BlB1]|uniref:hypothetical protein n=1 Tax=Methylobacter sp. BlB1 TaxID=2785914 RepID=UPI001E5760A8
MTRHSQDKALIVCTENSIPAFGSFQKCRLNYQTLRYPGIPTANAKSLSHSWFDKPVLSAAEGLT